MMFLSILLKNIKTKIIVKFAANNEILSID